MSLGAQQTVTSRIGERLKGRARTRLRCPLSLFLPAYTRYIINRFWFVCPGNELFLRPGGPDARIAETYGPVQRSTCFRRRRRRASSSSSSSSSFLHFLVPMLLPALERKGTRDASEAMTQLRKCYRYYVPSSPRTPAARPLYSSCTLMLCKQPYLKAILRSFRSTGFGQFFGPSQRDCLGILARNWYYDTRVYLAIIVIQVSL